MSLINAMLDKLKQGSIKNVILFSDQDVFPEPPYVVVKPEAGSIENTRQFRIVVHMKQGQFDELNNYCLFELDALLLSGLIEDEEDGQYKLYVNGYTDITPEPTDNTYFMERFYFTPLMIRS